MNSSTKVLIIVGPTSSGKSALAVELARKLNGEVISADSRQVYRGLNLGTGKITKREMKGVIHHLLDVTSPKKPFSAHDFQVHAERAIQSIAKRGKLPIVAGGTGMYIDTLLGRITLPEVAPNPALRARLAKKTVEQLYAELKKKDPRRAEMMDTPSERNNKVRLIRALEIASAAKKHSKGSGRHHYEALWIGINPPLSILEKKISARLRARIRQGMIAEAKKLHDGGLSYKRMHELGLEYRYLAACLQGEITRTEMVEQLERAIRKYAKRQMVYWKRNKDITWVDSPNVGQISKIIQKWQ